MGRETGLPTSSSLFSSRTISRDKQVALDQHLDGREGHGNASLHIQRARPPQAALAHPARHGFQRAPRPNGVKMAQQQGASRRACLGLRAEARLQHIAKAALTMQLHPSAQGLGLLGGQRYAGIHGRFVAGGRLGPHQLLNEVKESILLSPGSGQQGAHGNRKIGSNRHSGSFPGYFAGGKNEAILILRRLKYTLRPHSRAEKLPKRSRVWQKCHRTRKAPGG